MLKRFRIKPRVQKALEFRVSQHYEANLWNIYKPTEKSSFDVTPKNKITKKVYKAVDSVMTPTPKK